MLRSIKSLEGFSIGATDGPFGKVRDFYFDDQAWVIRYIVVDTSAWLGGREVLISPYSIAQPDWAGRVLPARITKQQIKDSPSTESDEPISRQYEKRYLGYYGYPYYWGGAGLWGAGYYPSLAPRGTDDEHGVGYRGYLRAPSSEDIGDPHLRSCEAVKGYHIHATDGELGHVQGFLIDDFTWSVRYLVVNTSNWWLGHQVLVSPEWIQKVSWAESEVDVSLDRQAIKDAPSYDEYTPFGRDDEADIYEHYGRATYWRNKHERAFV